MLGFSSLRGEFGCDIDSEDFCLILLLAAGDEFVLLGPPFNLLGADPPTSATPPSFAPASNPTGPPRHSPNTTPARGSPARGAEEELVCDP